MKTIKNSIVVLFASLIIASCNKVEVDTPVFEVQVDSLSYQVGEIVNFKFTGDADQITFYSGEVLNDYNFKDGRVEEILALNTSFLTAVRYGLSGGQVDLLSVWVSSNFNGNYTIEDVKAAEWKNNVSKNFILAPRTMDDNASANYVPSGVLDIKSEAEDGKPLYLAFRYKKDAGGKQRNWFMRNVSVNAVTGLGNHSLFDGSTFNLVYDNSFVASADKNSTITSGGVITLRSPTSLDPVAAEVWAISPPISIQSSDLGPDKGVPVKGFTNLKVDDYKHTYTKEGIYTATFVASNSNSYGESKVIKQVTVTVTN